MRTLTIIFAIALLGAAFADETPLSLSNLFTDHGVLQRDKPVAVWGWGPDGANVTVSIQGNEAKGTVKDGKWTATLPALVAGGPFTMTVSDGNETLTLNDVLVGEVWVCSGQSNMAWPMKMTAYDDVPPPRGTNPNIRLFRAPALAMNIPQENVPAQWTTCTPDTIGDFSAVGFNFGEALQHFLGIPVGLIQVAVGGSPVQAWTSIETMKADPLYDDLVAGFEYLVENEDAILQDMKAKGEAYQKALQEALQKGETPPPPPHLPYGFDNIFRPSGLYNAMLAPCVPYGIAGAIWYQGEANAGAAYAYRTMFPTMIENWRKDFGQGDFPFLFVQLAPFLAATDYPGDSAWAELRDAQLYTLKTVPNTGMAVITDHGNEKDIHPRRKDVVGHRLATWAGYLAYGKTDAEYSGPIYKDVAFENGQATITFDHIGTGLVAKGWPLTGFSMAGSDEKFYPANAKIAGNTVVVTCDDVTDPAAVRFGWSNYPVVNLFNKDGFPASPFRTDEFDLTTMPQ